MKREIKVMIFFYVGFMVTYAFLLLPEDESVAKQIPFSDVEMSMRSHVYYISERFRWILMVSAAWYYIEAYRHYFDGFFVLSCVYLADYLLFYHGPLFRILGFPVSYTLFMGIGMTFLITHAIWKSKT
jgi:hypothetical protein